MCHLTPEEIVLNIGTLGQRIVCIKVTFSTIQSYYKIQQHFKVLNNLFSVIYTNIGESDLIPVRF